MKKISNDVLNSFVNSNIDEFHKQKANILKKLSLKNILKKKNPYLFRAKNINSAGEFVDDLLGAFLSSSEEKLFGDFLEKLAIFISQKTCDGKKSSATGIDLEFENDDMHYIVSIKSGPNWGNSSSSKKQVVDFQNAVTVLKQANKKANIQPVLGICYGKQESSYRGNIMRVTGQSFWHLISGDKNLYTQIIEPIGYRAKEHNETFLDEKSKTINLFTQEFLKDFCVKGVIDWKKLVTFNSGNMK